MGWQDFVQTCNSGSDVVGLVLDRTPLYAEQGGQTFDKVGVDGVSGRTERQATLTCGDVEFSVDNAQKYVALAASSYLKLAAKAGYVLHIGQVESKGDLKVGSQVTIKVDQVFR